MGKITNIIFAYVKGNVLIRRTIRSKVKFKYCKNIDYKKNSYVFNHIIDIKELHGAKCINKEFVDFYLCHKYNFLGTGWKDWNKREEVKSQSFDSLDWHRDIMTKFEFKDSFLNSRLIDGLPHGVDIKIPWEMGRMYHWPQLALYAVNHGEYRDCIVLEFINQMNDFIDNNPPGYGVQHYCAMEIAIRSINIVISYDILGQLVTDQFGSMIKEKIENYLFRCLLLIVDRLEINFFTKHAGNHYLSDLCGILWLSMYYDSKKSGIYGEMAAKEYLKELGKQILADGSSFECSTGYHMFVTEITILAVIAIEKQYSESFECAKMGRYLVKMQAAMEVFTALDSNIVQVGDYDSGRVLKLEPVYKGDQENCLFSNEIKMGLNCIITGRGGCDYARLIKAYNVNNIIVQDNCEKLYETESNECDYTEIINKVNSLQFKKKRKIVLEEKLDCFDSKYLKEFGLLKIVSDKVNIYIRLLPDFSQMDLSHAHDDVFSFQIIYVNKRKYEDLGSVVYTSDTVMRDLFAGVIAHNVPIHSSPMIKRKETFVAETRVTGKNVIKNNTIWIMACWDGIVHIRKFRINNRAIEIYDYSNEKFKVNMIDSNYYSLGYGQLYRKNSNEHVRKINMI